MSEHDRDLEDRVFGWAMLTPAEKAAVRAAFTGERITADQVVKILVKAGFNAY